MESNSNGTLLGGDAGGMLMPDLPFLLDGSAFATPLNGSAFDMGGFGGLGFGGLNLTDAELQQLNGTLSAEMIANIFKNQYMMKMSNFDDLTQIALIVAFGILILFGATGTDSSATWWPKTQA